jgi:type IX secretion system PorP/SprF family membrane protein
MSVRKTISEIKNRGCTLLLLLLASAVSLKAQQDPVYSQYMNNIQSINPSYMGLRGAPTLMTIYRKQWLNFEGAPTSSSFTFNMPFDSMRVSGGFDFLYDYTLPTANLGLFFNYAYQFRATGKTRISLGLKAGFNYLEGKLNQLYAYHADDSYILNFGDFQRFMPNFGVGGSWVGENFIFGFAVPRLLQNPYNKENNVFTTKSREERHYFVHGAYTHRLSPIVEFQPAITTIMVAGAPITTDFDFAFHFYDQQFTFGALYRLSDSFGGYLQFRYETLKIGFAYDMTHSRLRKHNNGTFEVMIRYDLKPRKPKILEVIDEAEPTLQEVEEQK